MAIVIKLVKNEYGDEDIVFENGAIEMSENGEACAVQLKERMLLERNEALANPLVNTRANPLAGLDWEGIIFDAAKSKGEKELEIKRVIFSTPGVKKITYWSWIQTNRTLNLNFKIETEWGELEIGETVQL
jgi:hypothetical protein